MRATFTQNPTGYSIILSLVMIGFLLVLTTGTLNLVLQEMQDGKGKQDYLKASAAAEGSLELALFQIKDKGYGYYDAFSGANLLGTENKDPNISYSFEGKISSLSGTIDPFETEMIPLFWIDTSGQIQDIKDDLTFGASDEISWNIVSNTGGISGIGDFTQITPTGQKKLVPVGGNIDFSFEQNIQVGDFLRSSSGVYLLLYNLSDIPQDFTLTSNSGYFTNSKSRVVSSAKIGKYTQNLETMIDNTEFLGILKYSIYSGE